MVNRTIKPPPFGGICLERFKSISKKSKVLNVPHLKDDFNAIATRWVGSISDDWVGRTWWCFAADAFHGTLEPSSPSVSFKPEPYIFEGEDSGKNCEKRLLNYYSIVQFVYQVISDYQVISGL